MVYITDFLLEKWKVFMCCVLLRVGDRLLKLEGEALSSGLGAKLTTSSAVEGRSTYSRYLNVSPFSSYKHSAIHKTLFPQSTFLSA